VYPSPVITISEKRTGERIHVVLRGVQPLLMHAPNAIGAPASKKRVTSYDPEEEAAAALYKDPGGVIGVPNLVVLGAIREAAKEHKAAGKGRRTLKQFVLSGIRIYPDLIPIAPQEWTVDARPVVVQRARVMRWRPKFEGWSLKFDLEIVDPAVFTPSTVRDVLEDAGRFVGLCDFRPLFGTFEVEEFERIRDGV